MGMRKFAPVALSLVAAAAIGIAACGDDDDSASADATLSVSEVGDAGDVVVDAKGAAVYAADEEAGGEILCVKECESIWRPVTLAAGKEPSGDGLPGDLGTVTRPRGDEQVTLDDAPLYTFAEDGPDEVAGDGLSDSFGAQRFTWHVIRAEADSGDSEPSSGGGYGGY